MTLKKRFPFAVTIRLHFLILNPPNYLIVYEKPASKIQVPPSWAKHLLSTHPVVFITTVGLVEGKEIPGVAAFATCLDTSYEPPYVTFSTAAKQHSVVGGSKNEGEPNTLTNIKQNGFFVVNVPGKNLIEKLDIIAFPYERDSYLDKLGLAKLTKQEPFALSGKTCYPPLIGECLAHLECEVVDIHRPEGSDHFNVTGRVLAASYDKQLGDNLDEMRLSLAKQIFHHFGSDPKTQERYFAFLEVSKRPGSLVFQLEK